MEGILFAMFLEIPGERNNVDVIDGKLYPIYDPDTVL